uniref:Collectin-12 n=1 Tax=Magallana gigas TaxID=29159 RepID=K1RK92_MAGGI
MKFLVALILLELYSSIEGCEVGWVQFRTKCYMFSHTAASWAEAESICNAFHSILAEPRSHEESRFLISHSVNQAGEFWIGVSDIIEENRWIYSSDLQVSKVNDFHAGEPNGHTGANCVALWKPFRGYWADESCGAHYNFICEMSQDSGVLASWKMFLTSPAYCAVSAISVVGHFWIGISDIIKEDRWVYSSDLQPVRVTDFSPGQPNEYTSANCVALRKIFHGYWGDLPCSEHFNFICERMAK